MNETGKVLTAFFGAVAGLVAYIAWTLDDNTSINLWITRIVATSLSLLLLGLNIRSFIVKDVVPDFMSKLDGEFFERSGFQFLPEPFVDDDECHNFSRWWI